MLDHDIGLGAGKNGQSQEGDPGQKKIRQNKRIRRNERIREREGVLLVEADTNCPNVSCQAELESGLSMPEKLDEEIVNRCAQRARQRSLDVG